MVQIEEERRREEGRKPDVADRGSPIDG